MTYKNISLKEVTWKNDSLTNKTYSKKEIQI